MGALDPEIPSNVVLAGKVPLPPPKARGEERSPRRPGPDIPQSSRYSSLPDCVCSSVHASDRLYSRNEGCVSTTLDLYGFLNVF